MIRKTFKFSSASVDYYFAAAFTHLKNITDQKNTVLITDENVFNLHQKKFRNWNTIVLKPGEEYKVQGTVDSIIDQLIEIGADRTTTLIGVGGGVVCDLTGYVASIYMRGISFGFVPTTLLAMVDASIGGKNGIDVGVYKNMVGSIRQPGFILYDQSFLATLPDKEWQSGFAEIIKHGCIRDARLFKELEANTIETYKKKKALLTALIQRNALLKTKIVQQDEYEKGDRKLLNFGHTLGHALENQYELSHGEAISIGMSYASVLSQQLKGFKHSERVIGLLEKYGLPVFADFNKDKVFSVLSKDKKKAGGSVNFILLERIGKAVIEPIPLSQLKQLL